MYSRVEQLKAELEVTKKDLQCMEDMSNKLKTVLNKVRVFLLDG